MNMKRLVIVATASACLGATQARAQVPATAREAIEAEFRRDLTRVESAKISRLAALAASQPKDEASSTYTDLFRFAISVGVYTEAEPIAEAVLRSGGASSEVAMLAEMVNLVAEAKRGAYDQSLDSLSAAIQLRKAGANTEAVRRALPLAARLSLINVYTQTLIQAGQYEIARKALTMIRDTTAEPGIKSLVTGRLAQVGLVGKPAPAIVGTDLDGKPVSLADMKGNVVLVVFWTSWCLPNAQEAGRFGQVAAAYRDRGFRIVGVNLDALGEGTPTPEAVMPAVRRFLVEHNVTWPNLMNGRGEKDYAKAYGVTELPTNVLVSRDGTIVQVDVGAAGLEAALAKVIIP